MPESAKDRPVSSYEHVFLLAKRERYFFDADAIREAGSINRLYVAQPAGENGRNCRDVWRINPKQFQGAHFAVMPLELAERCVLARRIRDVAFTGLT
jgi:DNA modification methylase